MNHKISSLQEKIYVYILFYTHFAKLFIGFYASYHEHRLLRYSALKKNLEVAAVSSISSLYYS